MNRRTFLASLAAALILPEPKRVRAYSFLPGPSAIDRFAAELGMARREAIEACIAGVDVATGEFVTLVDENTVRPAVRRASINGHVYDWGSVELRIGDTVFTNVKAINYEGPASGLGAALARVGPR